MGLTLRGDLIMAIDYNLFQLAKRYDEDYIPDTEIDYTNVSNDPVAQAMAKAMMLRGNSGGV